MRSRRLHPSLAAIALAAVAGYANAQEIAPEHGKISTGDATPVGAGVLEIEFGYAPTRAIRNGWGSFDDSASAYEHGFGLSLTWGPVDALDFALETGYALVHDESGEEATNGHGHSDGAVGVRWRFLSAPSFDLAVTTGWTLPTGADGAPRRLQLSQSFYSWDSTLVASWDVGHATGNVELGYSLPVGSDREDARGVLLGNLAFGYHVLEWLQPEAELNYEHEVVLGADADLLAATGGVVIPWGEGHRITAGIQQALWGQNTSAFTGASLAYKAAF